MEEVYVVMLVALLALGVTDLVVGVSKDAINFAAVVSGVLHRSQKIALASILNEEGKKAEEILETARFFSFL